ncbi:potassium channel protein [Spirochaeta isovalerica]|uniref:Voltage-gated potassium channel n=1 Tax=Spirochaeta isovalerica TaxID=150 RepID=A0A841R5W1_9SPIO|nr:potassium channel protein [Spirochaeta isovalerica]MBB6479226.1 voltage-gated potassium channel [Spirochaeta isovalerica]
MTPLRRFIMALFFILFLISAGTAGFMIIESWTLNESLYMTFVTISTVGFGEIHPLSPEGRIFMMIFLTVSILTVGFTLTALLSFFFEGHMSKTVKERRMKRILSLIKEHYIICGFGDVGRETAAEFSRKKIPFVIVDNDLPETEKELFSSYVFISGDATEESVLEEARINKAEGLVSCLSTDQQNVYAVLTARQLNGALRIVAKASDERAVKKLETAGADRVILPKQIAGRRLATVSTHPSIVDFLDVLTSGGDELMHIDSVEIGSHSPLTGKSLKESNIGQNTGAIIIGILDSQGRTRMNSSEMASLSSMTLQPGNRLIALGNTEQIMNLQKYIG